MNDYEKLIELLDHPDDNFWGDILSCEARALIDSNPAAMFQRLLQSWHDWPENRLEHLAYLLGESDVSEEKILIYELLNSNYQSVVYRAKEALSEFKGSP